MEEYHNEPMSKSQVIHFGDGWIELLNKTNLQKMAAATFWYIGFTN